MLLLLFSSPFSDNIFHLDVHYMGCYIMLVPHLEPQGRRFTDFHYDHYYYSLFWTLVFIILFQEDQQRERVGGGGGEGGRRKTKQN